MFKGEFMFDFIKKLFGIKPEQIEETVTVVKTATKRVKKLTDVNNDGVINEADVREAKKRIVKKVKDVADVNKDGNVNLEDAKEVVKKISKKGIKKPSPPKSEIKQEIKEPSLPKKRGRKPKAK